MKNKKRVLALGCVAVLFLISAVTYAKYQVARNNKGMAIAGNFYFTSNYLNEITGTEASDIPYIYNLGVWTGQTDYIFLVSVQNYKNRLMFNETGLDVKYEITFELMPEAGQAVEGKYYVIGKDNVQRELVVGSKVTYQDCSLSGGTANADRYEIILPKPEEAVILEDYVTVPVLVSAKPIAPAYVSDSYKEKNKRLTAKFVANIVADKYSLTHGFTIKKSESETVAVSSWLGFPYEITYKPGSQNVPHTMELSWNHEMLQMDAHNELYQTVKNENSDENPVYIVDDVNKKTTIKFQIDPYETKEFVFLRTADFLENTTYEQLQGMVTLTDIDVTTP